MTEIFDFHPDHKNPSKFLSCPHSRALIHEDIDGDVIWSVDNMSDDELAKAIIDDILACTMWEIQTSQTLSYTFEEMCRFLKDNEQIKRVGYMLRSEVIQNFITFNNGQYRIKNNTNVLQAAMDFCEVWYSGFNKQIHGCTFSDSETREHIQNKIEQYGSIENLAKSLHMEMLSTTVQESKFIN